MYTPHKRWQIVKGACQAGPSLQVFSKAGHLEAQATCQGVVALNEEWSPEKKGLLGAVAPPAITSYLSEKA